MVLAVVATFSSANGIAAWIVLPPVLLANANSARRSWHSVAWVMGFAASLAIYVYHLQKPAYTPRMTEALHHPLDGLVFFFALLGSPLVSSARVIPMSAIIGAILASLFLVACWRVLTVPADVALKDRAIVWLMLGAYSFITAIIVAGARMGFGVEQAVISRYTTFTVYLPIALCYLSCLAGSGASSGSRSARIGIGGRRLLVFAASALVLLHVVSSVVAIRNMKLLRTARLQAKACMLFVDVVPDECLSRGFPSLAIVRERANAVNDLGFLRPPLIRTRRIRDLADTHSGSAGRVEKLARMGDSAIIVSGWARLPSRDEPADAVLLAYGTDASDATVFALANMKIGAARSVLSRPGSRVSEGRWGKTFPLSRIPATPGTSVSAWAFDATTGKAYQLGGAHVIDAVQSAAPAPRKVKLEGRAML
jgi:hypothetical protein